MSLAKFPKLYCSVPTGAFVRLQYLKILCFSNHTIPAATNCPNGTMGLSIKQTVFVLSVPLKYFFLISNFCKYLPVTLTPANFLINPARSFRFSRTAPQPSLISICRLSRSAPHFFPPHAFHFIPIFLHILVCLCMWHPGACGYFSGSSPEDWTVIIYGPEL